MDGLGLQCHGCGSSNVVFDPKKRILFCNQCGKREYYSRATLNSNGKVLFAKANAMSFFAQGKYDEARHYALDVLNISMDNAPAMYIISYYDEFISGRNDALKEFFAGASSLELEYEETADLRKLFLASSVRLAEYEEQVIELIVANMQDERDRADLSAFIDELCPCLISRRSSSKFLCGRLRQIYSELAANCDIPRTCFALLKAVESNPDSPYSGNTFYLRAGTEYFYRNFVLPVGEILGSMKAGEYKDRFLSAYARRKEQYEADKG